MSTPQPVLVYEFLSAGAIIADLDAPAQAELLAQGRAMRDAMLADLCALPGVRVSCVVRAPDRGALPDAGILSVFAPPAECHAPLLRQAALAGVWIWAVAPETGGALSRLATAVPAAQWLGCAPEAVALTSSKSATRRHLAAHGIPVPCRPADEPGPWVVKPDDGAGSVDTRRHASLAAAQAHRAGPAFTLEPWIDGEALSLSLCCGDTGPRLLSINRQHIEVDAQGHVHFLRVQPAAIGLNHERGERLAALACKVARAVPGLRGYVGIDLVWHDRLGPVVIEVNPRLTSAYVGLSQALGFNVAKEVLASWM